jgi:hypothetical protein
LMSCCHSVWCEQGLENGVKCNLSTPLFAQPPPSLGESGLGKSTLINSLFLTDLYSPEYPGPSHRIKKTVQVNTKMPHLFDLFMEYLIGNR